MFEMIIIACLSASGGEVCATAVSPQAGDRRACERVGNFVAHAVAAEMRRAGKDGRVSWACVKQGERA